MKHIFSFCLLIFSLLISGCELLPEQKTQQRQIIMKQIDWQGHRGARGLLPENTIPAFLLALSFPKIQTLEMDVVISKDQQVIISHEPFFSHHISSYPDGKPVEEAKAVSLNIYEMLVSELTNFDVGKRGNSNFPDQTPLPINKPTLKAMVGAIKEFCKKNKRTLPGLNIEIKSHPDGYDKYFPQPKKFVELVLAEIKLLDIEKYTNLQCFDTNILEEIHRQAPEISTALLVEEIKTFDEHLATISFTPTNFSPYFEFVTADLLLQAKAKGIKVIPWTVNELKDLQRMVDLGVDGIITDYPNRIEMLNLAIKK